MDTNVTVAIATSGISASAAVIVSVTALVLNNKRFDDFTKRLDKIEARLDHIESTLVAYVVDVATIKGKLGL